MNALGTAVFWLASLLAGLAGLGMASEATFGAVVMGGACVLAIWARMTQSAAHTDRLEEELKAQKKLLDDLLKRIET